MTQTSRNHTAAPGPATGNADAPQAPPAFPPSARRGPVVQVSGQGALDPATGAVLHTGDVAAQTTCALENVRAALAAGGASLTDVVMLRVHLTERAHYAAMNEAYGRFVNRYFGTGPRPCRTTVMVGLPLAGMLVEIDAQAVVGY
ncbi:RidA family protein [Streptomyces sp. NPDC048434]|uniref:RidA family protein n=1 Tax=Streptomyces sp. NPDC048434 TaxID=3365549 RepID=UPI0037182672